MNERLEHDRMQPCGTYIAAQQPKPTADNQTVITPVRSDLAGTSREALSIRFEHDVSLLGDQLNRLARRHVYQASDAEDLVQETLMRAWRAYATFEEGTNFPAWVSRIMTNTWITRYRTAQRRPAERLVAEYLDDGSGRLSTPSAETPVLASMSEVQQAMKSLPESQRLVIYYAYVEGLRHKDISALIGIPIGTVMSRLHRARHNLRVALGPWAYQHGYIGPESVLKVA